MIGVVIICNGYYLNCICGFDDVDFTMITSVIVVFIVDFIGLY